MGKAASSERRWVLRWRPVAEPFYFPKDCKAGDEWTHDLKRARKYASPEAARSARRRAGWTLKQCAVIRLRPVRPRRAAPVVNVGDEQMTAESFALRLMEYATESEPSVAVKRIAAAVSRLVFDANLTRLQKRMLGLAARLGDMSPAVPEAVARWRALHRTRADSVAMAIRLHVLDEDAADAALAVLAWAGEGAR